MRTSLIVALLGLLIGCAPRPAVKPEVRMTNVRRIAVQKFEGEGGAEATRSFLQALKGSGLEVVANAQEADALVTGMMTDYQARRKATIFLGTTQVPAAGSQSVKSTYPIFSFHSNPNASQISAVNPGIPQIVAETAVVGVVIRLQDVPKGTQLWGDEYAYEGLDLPTVLRTVTGVLAQSLQRAAPRLQHVSEPVKKG